MTDQLVYQFYQCGHPNACYGKDYYECLEVDKIHYFDSDGNEILCEKSPTQQCYDYVLVEKDSTKCGYTPEKYCIIDGVDKSGEVGCVDNIAYYCKPGSGWVVSNPMVYCKPDDPQIEIPTEEVPPEGEVPFVEEPYTPQEEIPPYIPTWWDEMGLPPVLLIVGVGVAIYGGVRLLSGRRR